MNKPKKRIDHRLIFAGTFFILLTITVIVIIFSDDTGDFDPVQEVGDEQEAEQELYFGFEIEDDQKAWADEHINLLLLQLMNDHPLESIRLRLEDGQNRAVEGEYILVVTGTEDPTIGLSDSSPAFALWSEEDQLFVMVLYVPRFMKVQEENVDIPGAYEDYLLILYLHELFHIINHPVDFLADAPEADRAFEAESEAWLDSVENVIRPIVVNGSSIGKVSSVYNRAMLTHTLSDGDRQNQYWKDFISTVVK